MKNLILIILHFTLCFAVAQCLYEWWRLEDTTASSTPPPIRLVPYNPATTTTTSPRVVSQLPCTGKTK